MTAHISPETFVAAVRAKGSDAADVRDAAHEACHAISWKVPAPWTRDNIHARKPEDHRIFGAMPGVREEVLARAVEQIVCEELGVDCGGVAKWAMVCWMEMLKNERVELPTDGWLEKEIQEAMRGERAKAMAAQVLKLAIPAKRKTRVK